VRVELASAGDAASLRPLTEFVGEPRVAAGTV